jgi:hypothetical protein
MKAYFVSINNKGLPVFMPTEMRSSSTRQDSKFNVKENESIKDIFYPPIPPFNTLFNRFWIDKNTKDISFDAEDITILPRFLNTPDYTIQKSLPSSSSIVQDSGPETVADVEQYARLKTMLQEEIAESGIANFSEKIIESLYSEDKLKANILVNKLFFENFHTPHIIVGVLHIVSHFDYDLVSPEGPTMAIAALAHKDVEVREYGVKCFENWQHKDGIRILEHIKVEERWLQNYINLVIRDLKNA